MDARRSLGEVERRACLPWIGGTAIATLIVADENQGRRNLMANTFERHGFDVTRLGTLQQALATTRGVVPDVLLVEAEWSEGDPMDVCSALQNEPRVKSNTRMVLLSRSTSPEVLLAAARSGIAEVIGKPVDMNMLIAQLQRHASKQFVPPPAEVGATQTGSAPGGVFGGAPRFDVGSSVNDSQWALPMLRRLVEAGNIDDDFINSLRREMSVDEADIPEVPVHVMQDMIRVALNRLVGASKQSSQVAPEPPTAAGPKTTKKGTRIQDLNKGTKLSEGAASLGSTINTNSMEDILEKQAQNIAEEVEMAMDGILEESPEFVALLPESAKVGVDPETIEFVRLTTQMVHDLMGLLRRRGALSDLTLLTTVEDLEGLTGDVLEALPSTGEEE